MKVREVARARIESISEFGSPFRSGGRPTNSDFQFLPRPNLI